MSLSALFLAILLFLLAAGWLGWFAVSAILLGVFALITAILLGVFALITAILLVVEGGPIVYRRIVK